MRKLLALAATVLLAGGVASAAPRGTGLASWYGARHEGRTMSNGCPFRAAHLTAASRTIPIGAMVRVRNRANGRVVTVQITDRGPYVRGRIIDLSRHAAEVLDFVTAGVVTVELERLPGYAAPAAHPGCARPARSPGR